MQHAATNDVVDLEQDLRVMLGLLRRADGQPSAFGFWKRCAEQVIERRARMQRVARLAG